MKPARIGTQEAIPRSDNDYGDLSPDESRRIRDRNVRYARDVRGWDSEKIARRLGLDVQLVMDILSAEGLEPSEQEAG